MTDEEKDIKAIKVMTKNKIIIAQRKALELIRTNNYSVVSEYEESFDPDYKIPKTSDVYKHIENKYKEVTTQQDIVVEFFERRLKELDNVYSIDGFEWLIKKNDTWIDIIKQ